MMIVAESVSMGKALLNTVMGMGTVFIVLIFISFVISLFDVLNKRMAEKEETKGAKESTVETAIHNAISQIEKQEELADDLELVAVITAAIAAYRESTSDGMPAEGFQVRSIKRAARHSRDVSHSLR